MGTLNLILYISQISIWFPFEISVTFYDVCTYMYIFCCYFVEGQTICLLLAAVVLAYCRQAMVANNVVGASKNEQRNSSDEINQ